MKILFLLAALNLELVLVSAAQRPGAEVKPATSISAVTQNLRKFEGFYTFYYDEKTGKVLLEVDRWGQEFLYFSTLPEGIGNGGAERGQASAVIAKFIKIGPKVFLLQPNSSVRAVHGNSDEQRDVED